MRQPMKQQMGQKWNKARDQFKQLPVGKKFTVGINRLKVAKISAPDCSGCFFDGKRVNCNRLCAAGGIPECVDVFRDDGVSVIFVEDFDGDKEVCNEKRAEKKESFRPLF